MSGDATNKVQADAIDFTGGTNNSLTLNTTASNGGLTGGLGLGGTVTIDPGTATTLTSVLHDYNGYNGTMVGTLVKAGSGTLRLEGASTYSNGTQLKAGTLDLAGTTSLNSSEKLRGLSGSIQSAAAGTGIITFSAPQGATLAIEQGALINSGGSARFYNLIAGFATAQNGAAADVIDLRGLKNGTATFDYSTDQLSVTGTAGGTQETEVLTLQGDYSGLYFNATSDSDGNGTAITLTATPPTSPPSPPPPAAPTITGTHATADAGECPVLPFGASAAGGPVTIGDTNSGATDSLAITLTGTGGTLTGAGLTGGGNSYALAATDPGTLSRELDALQFKPTNSTPGATVSTGFQLTDTSSAGTSATNGMTAVTDTAAAAPTPPTTTPPAPAPTDAVAISPTVTYADGTFRLTGTASSTAGVRSVEISALVDGARHDLGAATVNANGTFSFQDAARDQQTFLVATLTDDAGGTATSADPGFNLTGGLGPRGTEGRQDSFSPTQEVSSILFRADGTRQVSVEASGQTVNLQPYDAVFNHGRGNNTFVYTPGGETGVVDTIHGFVAGGANHDVLSLNGADFGNSIAKVLRDTGDVGSSAFLTDPVTGDGILFAGVSTAQLKPKDFSFHG